MPALLDLPSRIQNDDYSCGAVAIAISLTHDGIPVGRWIKKAASPVVGLSADAVSAIMHSAYHGNILTGTMNIPLLRHLTGQGRPVLALITVPGRGCSHWIVISGYRRGRIHYACPTNGRKSLPVDEFEQIWESGDSAGGWRLDRFGVVGFPS